MCIFKKNNNINVFLKVQKNNKYKQSMTLLTILIIVLDTKQLVSYLFTNLSSLFLSFF